MSLQTLETLRKVEFLAALDEAELAGLAKDSREERYPPGARMVAELEFGADVFVILEGNAEVSVDPRQGERQVLGKLVPGSAVGEMSSLSGELRSATVSAVTAVLALRIPKATFDALRSRRPEVAVALLEMLSRRLAEGERSVDQLLSSRLVEPPPESLAAQASRGSITRAWRELVSGRGKDLGFLALVGFIATLIAVRALVYVSFRLEFAPRDVLRGLYTGGFLLLMLTSCASLLTFRPAYRRFIAGLFGVSAALIANALGVTLAFDIFYKDIFTPDPNVSFDIERLYRRTETMRGIAIAFAVLFQLAYLRPFYRRLGFMLKTRLRRLASRS